MIFFYFFLLKIFLTLKIGTESSKLFISYGNSLLNSFLFLFNFYIIWPRIIDRSMISCPFCVKKFHVNMRLSP